MAKLVRIFHDVTVEEAKDVVESLVDRTVPILWRVGDVVRILDPSLNLDDGTLLRLYSDVAGVNEKKLAVSLEQKDISIYRRVLRRLHGKRLFEYNETTRRSTISPTGIRDVEERILIQAWPLPSQITFSAAPGGS